MKAPETDPHDAFSMAGRCRRPAASGAIVVLAISDAYLADACRHLLLEMGTVVIPIARPLALLSVRRVLAYDLVCVDSSQLGYDSLAVQGGEPGAPALGLGLAAEGLTASLALPVSANQFLGTVEGILADSRITCGGVQPRLESPSRRGDYCQHCTASPTTSIPGGRD